MRRWLALALLMLPAWAPPAWATCSVSATALGFGTYTDTLLNSVSSVTINCSDNTSFHIGLNAGTGIGATVITRKMTGLKGATLNYEMFQNSARTINWGNTPGTDTVSGTNSGNPQRLTVYAEVAAGQIVAPGTYTDTIIVSATGSGTVTTTFTVTAVVQPTCQITATDLAFGIYANTQTDATSTISVTCTRTTPYNVGLDNGGYGRRMNTNKADRLPYILAQDSARAVNWGTNVGTDTKAGTGSGALQTLTVYGRILAAQYKNPGSYSDTVTATITY